jgi:hypothetical protein
MRFVWPHAVCGVQLCVVLGLLVLCEQAVAHWLLLVLTGCGCQLQHCWMPASKYGCRVATMMFQVVVIRCLCNCASLPVGCKVVGSQVYCW